VDIVSHLEPIDCPFPTCQIFLACVISGIDLIFHTSTARWATDLMGPRELDCSRKRALNKTTRQTDPLPKR